MINLIEKRYDCRETDTDTSRLILGYEYFAEFIEDMDLQLTQKGDACEFLLKRSALQDFLNHQDFQYLPQSKQDLIDYCNRYRIVQLLIGGTPTDYAIHVWAHENAHLQAAKKHEITSDIRISWVKNGNNGYFIQPWVYLDINDLERHANSGKLKIVMGEILIAPSLIGFGYKAEENVALDLLGLSAI